MTEAPAKDTGEPFPERWQQGPATRVKRVLAPLLTGFAWLLLLLAGLGPVAEIAGVVFLPLFLVGGLVGGAVRAHATAWSPTHLLRGTLWSLLGATLGLAGLLAAMTFLL